MLDTLLLQPNMVRFSPGLAVLVCLQFACRLRL
jgi:hypothetical protein